jgi:deoxyribodipyrimidine photo-lyase
MADSSPVIVWFRDDLRLSDQPALLAAVQTGHPILCVYIVDDESKGVRPLGGASRWWLHHSLSALARDLEAIGGRLDLLRGQSATLLLELAKTTKAQQIFWTRRYAKGEIALDEKIKTELKQNGIQATSFNGQLLFEPWTVQNKTGDFYRVFTPFWKCCLALPAPPTPTKTPKSITASPWPKSAPSRTKLRDLELLPTRPNWAKDFEPLWQPGEAGAKAQLSAFLKKGIKIYNDDRNRPDRDATSRLSPYLRFGNISARQVFWAARHAEDMGSAPSKQVEKFLSEIGWREFAYHLLFHAKNLLTDNFQPKFDHFPWRKPSRKIYDSWTKGLTGYPIVDAGMRELWLTGTMHNRVRMIVASFLVKHLLIDWRVGEDWFWDTLLDADPANNPESWQWVAGCGADAAPYFRIFNPILQGEKFDPDGVYVRRFVPELRELDSAYIHHPWDAPQALLLAAGVTLGANYPKPIIDHIKARDEALAALAETK